MAVGMDMALPRKPLGIPRSQQASLQQPAPQASASFPSAPSIADGRVQAAANNQLAASGGVGDAVLRDSARSGISRGRGQQYAADIAQQNADMQARVAASQTEMGSAAADAASRQAAEAARTNERLASANLLEGLRSANAMERVQRRGWQQSLYEAMRRGQFGLDQQAQMDFTPLLHGLFR